MESDDVREALRAAERSFERMPETIEEGLDVDDPELVQLRRACRLLSAGSMLLDRGFYTVGIELRLRMFGESLVYLLVLSRIAVVEVLSPLGSSNGSSSVP